MKKYVPLFIALVLSLAATILIPKMEFGGFYSKVLAEQEAVNALVPQKVVGVGSTSENVKKLYQGAQLIGVVNDYSKIQKLMKDVYNERYKADFPNSEISFGEDMYLVEEKSYYRYEDIDDALCTYLNEKDLFSVEANKIEFSNGDGTYATIYVKNVADFDAARDQFLLNFISQEALDLIRIKQLPPELKTYGRREIGINIMETISVSKGSASASKILKDKQEILRFLSYGYDETQTLYKVEEYDTVEGVGSKNGLSAQQVVTINNDKLKSADQVLEVGQELNVKYFESPINVVVSRERLEREPVYPGPTIYRDDPTMREGDFAIEQEEVVGTQNVKYNETWINGVLVSGEVVSSIITKQPQQEIVKRGTKVIPGVGTGKFRWPVDNPSISCRWGCYRGHQALDVQNAYNRYGSVIAADRGTVVLTSYHRVSGYYIVIDHNNGLYSFYGHMSGPASVKEGVNVNKGEVIGKIGMTGVATGPHVHFSIGTGYTTGALTGQMNPCKYLGC